MFKTFLKWVAYLLGFLALISLIGYGVFVEYLKLQFLLHFAH